MNELPSDSNEVVNTGGGPAIQGNLNTGGGDFAGRDQLTHILGDEVHGDKIGRDKITVGDTTDSTIAIGRGSIATSVKNFFFGSSEDTTRLRNRQAMLKLVHDIWVKGVLEHSLYNQLLIDLDMEQRPEAVERPWGMVLETPAQASRLLPSGTKMIDVFAELNQSLLILGEPGSGKSTMLLELARDLLAQAAQNPALPMPVLFNLSSWAEKRHQLRQWLVDELREKYQIPRALAQAWVEHDELLLLLDGLDEVKREYREDCVNALNEFQQSGKTLVPLALCSRAAEYAALTSKLKLNGAIVLHPLTPQQIDTFLLRAGDKLSAVAHLLQYDVELQTLAQSPLTFSILCLTYQDKALADVEPVDGGGTRLQQLFDAYIVRMFQRLGKLTVDLYPGGQTLRWLVWLAKNMVQRQQTIFLIEWLQPDWLQTRTHVRLYRLVVVLIVGLLLGLSGVPLVGLSVHLLVWLFIGLIVGLILGLRPIGSDMQFRLTWRIHKTTLYFWLRAGLITGLIFWLLSKLTAGLIIGLFVVLIFGLHALLKRVEPAQYMQPNQGIWRSVTDMWQSGLIVGLIFGLRHGLSGGLLAGLSYGLSYGLIGVLISYGGDACIQHIVLRSLLTLYNYTPFNYAHFLDYCADRIFLRKVGGGYIFIHRLLMEYFASLTEADIQRLAKGN